MKLRRLLIVCTIFVALCALYIGGLHLSGNFHEVIPGELYRSGQLSDVRLDSEISHYGIRTVLNLRGENLDKSWYQKERRIAKAAGIDYVNFRMSSKHELTFEEAKALIATMQTASKPILIHCDGGSDRTGFASALYLAAIAKQGEWAAERQLWPIYGHLPLQINQSMAMNRTFESLESYLGFDGS